MHHGRDATFGGCEGRVEHSSGAIKHLRDLPRGAAGGWQKSATQVYALFALAISIWRARNRRLSRDRHALQRSQAVIAPVPLYVIEERGVGDGPERGV